MLLVNEGLSERLFKLFLLWQEEYVKNVEHDVHETKAWNALIQYLMELEKGKTK